MVLRKISTFATVVTGGTPSTRNKEYWKNGDIPWLPSGVCQDCIVESAPSFITRLGLDCSAAKMMPPDTVLIALTGATAGKVGYLTFDASANQSVTGILPGKDHVPKYVFYFLQFRRKKTLADCYGGAQPHISQGYVKNIEVPLLPLDDQKRIADELDQLCALKKNAEDRLAILGQIAKSLFVEMFGDPLSNEMKWPVEELGGRCQITTGNTPPRADSDNYGSSVEWVKSDNLVNGHVLHAAEMLSEKGAKLARHAQTGDLLMTCIAGSLNSIGNASILDRHVTFNQQINAISPQKDNPVYLLWLFRIGKPILHEGINKVLKGILNKGNLSKKLFPFPPRELQDQYAAFIEQLDKSQFALRETVATLDQLYRAKLQEYFG